MKLVHITTVPLSLGFLKGQVGFMREHGLEVSAVSSPGERLDDFAASEDVPVKAISMTRRISPLRDLISLVRLIWWLRQERPQIVHAHTPKAGLLGMIAATLCGVPVRVYHIRGLPLATAKGVKRMLLAASERLACRLAHRVLAVSHSMRTQAINHQLCPAEKLYVIHQGSGNGVDAAGRFHPNRISPTERHQVRREVNLPDSAVVVGFVGRVARDKGMVELATTWRQIRGQFPHAHLLIVGPAEPHDPLPTAVQRQLEQDDRVHFTGPNWNTPPLYAAMDLVVLPTYREGFPNVPMEAAAMKRAVVATQIPGCTDAVVNGVTGTLVPPRDAEALTAAITAYLADPSMRQRHGLAGRERVLRDFDPEIIWRGIFAQYAELLEQQGLPLPATPPVELPARRAA